MAPLRKPSTEAAGRFWRPASGAVSRAWVSMASGAVDAVGLAVAGASKAAPCGVAAAAASSACSEASEPIGSTVPSADGSASWASAGKVASNEAATSTPAALRCGGAVGRTLSDLSCRYAMAFAMISEIPNHQ